MIWLHKQPTLSMRPYKPRARDYTLRRSSSASGNRNWRKTCLRMRLWTWIWFVRETFCWLHSISWCDLSTVGGHCSCYRKHIDCHCSCLSWQNIYPLIPPGDFFCLFRQFSSIFVPMCTAFCVSSCLSPSRSHKSHLHNIPIWREKPRCQPQLSGKRRLLPLCNSLPHFC